MLRVKIAVIGGGIGGLAAAWLLGDRHDVTLLERHPSPGMAAHGVQIGAGAGACRVDVPLRVFYPGYYPRLTALYQAVGVTTEPVDYSATFCDERGAPFFGYRNVHLGPLAIPLVDPRALLRPAARRIVRDLARLYRHDVTRDARRRTIGELLDEERYSREFALGFLFPTFATICTCTYASVRDFPAEHVIDYLTRGVLLTSVRRASGGADAVVAKLTSRVRTLRCAADVRAVEPAEDHAVVVVDGARERFDHVVIAAQANQALRLLAAPTDAEQRTLSAFRYEPVEVVMHTDPALMPARRSAWAPVNLTVSPDHPRPASTIWMNAVQPALRGAAPVFQTVSPLVAPRAETVLATARFERSVVTAASAAALDDLTSLHREEGRRVWFCGSYARAGIPLLESAVASAHAVADALTGTAAFA
jgi:predicted NAD/FAD-binding protein